jgi:hypothetical protein
VTATSAGTAASAPVTSVVDLGRLGLDRGGHLLVKRALATLPGGARLEVQGRAQELATHLRAWCRAQGHALEAGERLVVVRGTADRDQWYGAVRAGGADDDAVRERPPASWGLAARSALVEAGGPELHFPLDEKNALWSDLAGDLYRQALRSQWDPDTAIPWDAPLDHPEEVEDALVQILTYLIENETAALLIPARFAAQTHPHFREVLQLLAIQSADEARHVEVFTRRAVLRRKELGLSTAGGQASLKTLVEEPDFELASFLLSVLGEGTFLNLLAFLRRHAPDACTQEIMRLAAADEARHVAFGMGHLLYRGERDPSLLDRLAMAIERRHDALRETAGLNEEVFDALVLLAAGGWSPDQISRGHDAVVELNREMDQGRQSRLRRLGFEADRAAALSALHTRNFM